MMKTSMSLFIFAQLVVLVGASAIADSGTRENVREPAGYGEFQRIVDLDFVFFMEAPKNVWGADPFRRQPGFASVPTVAETFKLDGIAVDSHGSKAIIDSKMVTVGDRVGRRRVVKIGSNYVVLEKGDSQIELLIPPIESEDKP